MTTPQNGSSQHSASDVALKGVNDIDSLLSTYKWGDGLDTGTTLSYSFPWTTSSTANWSTSYSDTRESSSGSALNGAQQASARAALASWASVANVKFTELTESSGNVGDIRFAWTAKTDTTSTGGASIAWAYYPDDYHANGGDVWLSKSAIGGEASSYWQAGADGLQTLIHELGHALGLKHPFEDSPRLPASGDTQQYTVMSYTDNPRDTFVQYTSGASGYTWSSYAVYSDTPSLYDIAAIQYLYGANLSYKTGDDVYTFDPSQPFFRTLWDAAGNDTISVANYSRGCVIDLQPGHYSKMSILSESPAGANWTRQPPAATYDGSNALAIAYGCDIENATGGGGADTLIGNTLMNRLQGGAGNDTLTGGAGDDTLAGDAGDDVAVYAGRAAEYSVSLDAAGAYLVADSVGGRDGSDRLSGIEALRFSDGLRALGSLVGATAPPAGTGTPPSVDPAPTPPATQAEPPVVALAQAELSVVEGNSGVRSVALGVTLGAISASPVSLHYTLRAGTASLDSDIGGARSGTLTIGAGETGTSLTLSIRGDTKAEANEYFWVDFDQVGNASFGAGAGKLSAKVTIVDDDTDRGAPTVTSFSPADGASGVAPGSNLVFRFNEPIARGAGNITIKTADGAVFATYNSASSGNLGISGSTLTINPSADLASGTGYVVEFGAGSLRDLAGNAYAGGKDYNFATATVVKPTVTLSAAQSSISEGNAGSKLVTFTAKLSAAATAQVGVAFSTTDGSAHAGSDYTATSGSLIFAAGSTSKSFTVAVRGDTTVEGNENFYVSLTGASGATLGKADAIRASVTITNDDAAKAAQALAGAAPAAHALAPSAADADAAAALSGAPDPLADEPAALLVGSLQPGLQHVTPF